MGLMSGLDAVDEKSCMSSDPTLLPNPYIDRVICAPSLNYHYFEIYLLLSCECFFINSGT